MAPIGSCLNTWSLFDGTVWEGLGVSLEVSSIEVSKDLSHSQHALLVFQEGLLRVALLLL